MLNDNSMSRKIFAACLLHYQSTLAWKGVRKTDMELDSEASTSQGPALPSTSSPRSNGAASGAADVEGGKGRGSGKASGRARGKGRDKGKGRGQRDGQDGAAADGAGLTLVEKLALSPYSSELHLASIAAATSDDEREEARAFMAQMVPLTEEQWMEWIKDRKLQVGTSLEGKVEMLELYKRACSDSLCTFAVGFKVFIDTSTDNLFSYNTSVEQQSSSIKNTPNLSCLFSSVHVVMPSLRFCKRKKVRPTGLYSMKVQQLSSMRSLLMAKCSLL